MKKVFAWIDRGVEYAVAVFFAAMCAVGLLQVFNRFVLNKSLSWSEEFQIFCHVWIVFLAIPIAYRRGEDLVVLANFADAPAPVPHRGRVLLTSGPDFANGTLAPCAAVVLATC